MYSYEDRIRAVKLYIKLGKRTGATLRQLGYPTKNALKSWHREYEQGRDLPVSYARSKPKYSDKEKNAAVQHYLDHGRCLAGTLKALGYPCRDTLAAWVDEAAPRNEETRCRQSAQRTAPSSAQAGSRHRAVHPADKCPSHCTKARREQVGAVQMEKPTTRL